MSKKDAKHTVAGAYVSHFAFNSGQTVPQPTIIFYDETGRRHLVIMDQRTLRQLASTSAREVALADERGWK